VEREGAFGGVDPLQDGVAFGVAWGWEEAVGMVVEVAEVSVVKKEGGCFSG